MVGLPNRIFPGYCFVGSGLTIVLSVIYFLDAMADLQTALSPPKVRLTEIFSTFLAISLSSIGGGLQAWARRLLVERKRWLTEAEFIDLLGLCQLLPGPNVVNVSICTGRMLAGPQGALAAVLGLLGVPVLIAMVMGYAMVAFGTVTQVQHALHAMAVVAAGFSLHMALSMAKRHDRKPWGVLVTLVAFALLAGLHWPLWWVVGLLGPLSYLAAWRAYRRQA